MYIYTYIDKYANIPHNNNMHMTIIYEMIWRNAHIIIIQMYTCVAALLFVNNIFSKLTILKYV